MHKTSWSLATAPLIEMYSFRLGIRFSFAFSLTDKAVWLHGAKNKLSSWFYGPFQVGVRVGPVAYKLILLDSARIHPVFYVSALKPFMGNIACNAELPAFSTIDSLVSPQAVLDTFLKNGKREFLIHWSGLLLADASWLEEACLKSQFPEFVFDHDHTSPEEVMSQTRQPTTIRAQTQQQ